VKKLNSVIIIGFRPKAIILIATIIIPLKILKNIILMIRRMIMRMIILMIIRIIILIIIIMIIFLKQEFQT
jgi:hypothetical protein